jgi:hypothetical protein
MTPPLNSDPDFADVQCPDCGMSHLAVVSLFGGSTAEVLFQCLDCRSCFNWIKWRHKLPPIPAKIAKTSRPTPSNIETETEGVT